MAGRSKTSEPTESELAILNILWRRGASSVREVWQEFGAGSGYTTVLKFLQIMLGKGLVERDDSGHSHIYSAAVKRDDTQRRLLGRLVDRAFDGSVGELVLRALSAKPISKDELSEIRALLDKEERKQ